MNDEFYMEKAIELSKAAAAHGNEPFGAVLVRQGEIVFTNENRIYTRHDPTFHAEFGLIREFCAATGITDLREYTLYSSCEPCFMCCGAMVWTKLGRLVYGASDIDLCEILGVKGSECSKIVFEKSGANIEVVSGMDAAEYFQREIFEPLGMTDSSFWPTEAQKARLVHAYKRKKGKLVDVTGTKEDMDGMLHRGPGYIAGCGGLFSTLTDYDRFVQMLANGGTYRGKVILKPETVERMHTEAPAMHLEPDPGQVWGLGVKIRQDPEKGKLPVTAGTYGWSGAFGTHFFISPADKLSCVWVTNRTDLGGSGSYISAKIEELVFARFAGDRS